MLRVLPDGSYLSEITNQPARSRTRIPLDKVADPRLATHIPVRVVEYQVQTDPNDDTTSETFRIITNILDPDELHATRFVTPRRDAKGRVLPLGGAEPIPAGCRRMPSPYLIRWFRCLPAVSLRIAGDWRADHSGDVVDTEPKMTKAVLVAGGGFIPDEDRILRPADGPGRPPFLRPVGANQSRDDGDGAHPAHRHLARLHDVAVLNTCHMTSIEHVCQRRADHALPGWAGSGMARSKRREIRRMQLGSVRRCSLIFMTW